ncbi:methylated-DNA--[protein]-cysteine S-methyltransferase [Saccharopolyspora sp. MS10]|uniref:methylated-DNA--[protein]-cysteine S-methyltransferase n=1 Tax=Saccharopolyspora sp. MS10 TaxID=3385973 RepID=UPI00399F53C1
MSTVHAVVESPLGALTLVARDDALTALHFADGRHRGQEPGERTTTPLLAEARRQLAEYFDRRRTEFDLPLAPEGEPFQLRVWALLREIPFGATRTYGELARQLGHVRYAQAVGAANGRNPLPVIVPCHRVIGADGGLTGYAGGLDRKRSLLALEEPPAEDAGRLF